MSCPACGAPALIAQATGERACSDPECVAAHGFNRGGLIPITWALAGQWWPDACVLWDRDIASDGWEPRLLVECTPAPAHHTFCWTDDDQGQRLWSDETVTRAEGPLHWILRAHDVACGETSLMAAHLTTCRCVVWAGDRWDSPALDLQFTNSVGSVTGADLTVENLVKGQRAITAWVDEQRERVQPREWRREYLGQWVPTSAPPLERPRDDMTEAPTYARRFLDVPGRRR